MKSVEDLDLNGIEAFVNIARHGGFRTAARNAKISQSSLSKRLARLEHTLGYQLFARGGDMLLTAEGERLLPRATSLLMSAQDLMRTEQVPTGQRPFRLGVACSACVGIADRFMSAANQDGFDVDPQEGISTALLKDVQSSHVDAMLGRYPLDELPTGIEGRVIATDRLGIVCVEGHHLDRQHLSMKTIGDTPIVGFQTALSPGLETELAACWKKGGRTWNPIRRATGPAALLALVQAGIGVTVLPDRAFSPVANLRFRVIEESYAVSKVVLIWKTNGCQVNAESLLGWALDSGSRASTRPRA